MPRLTTESFGAGDQSWLGSTHALHNARTETVDISAFTAATHYPLGYIPSGFPVSIVGGLLVPYTVLEATTTGAGILFGHIAADVHIGPAGATAAATADTPAALLDHGRVKVAKVAAILTGFIKPLAAAKNNTLITYI